MTDIFEQATSWLEFDERLVYHSWYKESPWLYDKILGEVYLIKDTRNSPPTFDWVWEHTLKRVMRPGMVILAQLLMVRVRDPLTTGISGWIVSEEEYRANRDNYEVLDIFVVVATKEEPVRTLNISAEEYQAFYNDYEQLGVCYLVRSSYGVRTNQYEEN